MQAGSVNASVLLASFLGKENEKIEQEIARSDFAGELGKYYKPARNEAADRQAAKDPASTNGLTSTNQVEDTAPRQRNARTDTDRSLRNTGKGKSAATQSDRAAESKARIKDQKAIAENGENIFITNPLLAESILTELHYPSEIIKTCKSLQNKDGWISIADFKALLANQPAAASSQQSQAPAPDGNAQVSTAQVQALLGTIVQRLGKDTQSASGTFKCKPCQTATLPASSQTSGVCTISGLKSAIDNVLQKAVAESSADNSITRAPIAPSSAAASAQEIRISGDVMMTPKQGQAENVTAATIPSFVSDDSAEEGEDVADSTDSNIQKKNMAAITQSNGRTGDGTETAQFALPRSINQSDPNSFGSSQMNAMHRNPGGPSASGQPANPYDPAAGDRGQNAQNASGLATAAQLQSSQDLASLAKELGARIVSSGSDDSFSTTLTSNQVVYAGTLEESTLQKLNLAPSVNTGTEKQAMAVSPGQMPPLDVQEIAGANGLEIEKKALVDAEDKNPGVEASTKFVDENQGFDLPRIPSAEDGEGQAFNAAGQKKSDEQLQGDPDQMGNREGEQAIHEDLARRTKFNQDLQKNYGTLSDPVSIDNSAQAKAGSPVADESTAVRSDAVLHEDAVALQEPTGTEHTLKTDAAPMESDQSPGSLEKRWGATQIEVQPQIASKTGETASESTIDGERPLRTDSAASRLVRFPSSAKTPVVTTEAGEQSTSGAQSGNNGIEALAQQGTDSDLAVQIGEAADTSSQSGSQAKSSAHGHNAASIAGEVEAQFKRNDAAHDSAVMHGLIGSQQESRIEMPGMQQSMTDGGTANYYDPGRSVQIVESYREHLRSIGGRQLTLEMEPGEFGKMSVKVGTHKDEVSAVIMTENESTRQALLRNSPELRQDMENNGLELGKFMVDVNRQDSGKQGSEWQSARAKNTGTVTRTVNTTEQPKTKPSYLNMNGRLSRVSLFA